MLRAPAMNVSNTPFQIANIDVGHPRHSEAPVRVAAGGVRHSNPR